MTLAEKITTPISAPTPATINGRTTEAVLREIVAEEAEGNFVDDRIKLLVARFDARAIRRAEKNAE